MQNNLCYSKFDESIIEDANWKSIVSNHCTFFIATMNNIKMTHADLRDSDFFQAKLHRADLAKANLSKVDFSFVELNDCDLVLSNLTETSFNFSDLRGAKLGRFSKKSEIRNFSAKPFEKVKWDLATPPVFDANITSNELKAVIKTRSEALASA